MRGTLIGICLVLAGCVDDTPPNSPDSGTPLVDAGPPFTSCPDVPADEAPCDATSPSFDNPCVYPGNTEVPGKDCTCYGAPAKFICSSGTTPCPADMPVQDSECDGEFACEYEGTRCDCVIVLDIGPRWSCFELVP